MPKYSRNQCLASSNPVNSRFQAVDVPRFQSAPDRIDKLQRDLRVAELSNRQLNDKSEKATLHLTSSVKRIEELELELHEATLDLQEADKLVTQITVKDNMKMTEIDNYKAQLLTAKDDLEAKEAEFTSYKSEAKRECRENMKKLKTVEAKLRCSNSASRREKLKSQKELEATQKELHESELSLATTTTKQSELQKAHKALKASQTQLQQSELGHNNELVVLQKELHKSELSSNTKQESLNKCWSENEKFRRKAVKDQLTIEELQKELIAAREQSVRHIKKLIAARAQSVHTTKTVDTLEVQAPSAQPDLKEGGTTTSTMPLTEEQHEQLLGWHSMIEQKRKVALDRKKRKAAAVRREAALEETLEKEQRANTFEILLGDDDDSSNSSSSSDEEEEKEDAAPAVPSPVPSPPSKLSNFVVHLAESDDSSSSSDDDAAEAEVVEKTPTRSASTTTETTTTTTTALQQQQQPQLGSSTGFAITLMPSQDTSSSDSEMDSYDYIDEKSQTPKSSYLGTHTTAVHKSSTTNKSYSLDTGGHTTTTTTTSARSTGGKKSKKRKKNAEEEHDHYYRGGNSRSILLSSGKDRIPNGTKVEALFEGNWLDGVVKRYSPAHGKYEVEFSDKLSALFYFTEIMFDGAAKANGRN
ncbi:hypothetical protein TrVE_jg4255 [Triparma verrucosa]|uniref:Uncharacterized protein n=2 Tax=Triparma verrucosa TaxID=1606542 RepID=A0A9W7KVN5_9STRA|nr:hypothetical protein TrVE_jg4255 [Triparma verrucosa]